MITKSNKDLKGFPAIRINAADARNAATVLDLN